MNQTTSTFTVFSIVFSPECLPPHHKREPSSSVPRKDPCSARLLPIRCMAARNHCGSAGLSYVQTVILEVRLQVRGGAPAAPPFFFDASARRKRAISTPRYGSLVR